MRNKIVAALIAFFAGSFGIHHFYLGNKGKGIAYLIFFWTFIPAILSFFDCLMLIFMDDHVFDEKYNPDYLDYDHEDSLDLNTNRFSNYSDNRYQGLDLDKLEKLGRLRENGILTEEEFQAQKEYLLDHR